MESRHKEAGGDSNQKQKQQAVQNGKIIISSDCIAEVAQNGQKPAAGGNAGSIAPGLLSYIIIIMKDVDKPE